MQPFVDYLNCTAEAAKKVKILSSTPQFIQNVTTSVRTPQDTFPVKEVIVGATIGSIIIVGIIVLVIYFTKKKCKTVPSCCDCASTVPIQETASPGIEVEEGVGLQDIVDDNDSVEDSEAESFLWTWYKFYHWDQQIMNSLNYDFIFLIYIFFQFT